MNCKNQNENRPLAYGIGAGILILGTASSAFILNHEIQIANRELAMKSNPKYLIFRHEDLDSNFNFATLNLETASKIEPENSISTQQIQNQTPFFNLSPEDRHTICCIVAGEAKGESMEGKMAVATCIA